MSNRVTLALGSNLGDRLETLKTARDYLKALNVPGAELKQAPIYSSEPVDCPPGSQNFYNTAIELEFKGTPSDLLHETQKIEKCLGRPAVHGHNAPRTVDIDILHFGDQSCDTKVLSIPHKRLKERRFVLQPLSDIRPNLVLPEDRKTILQHLTDLSSPEPPLTLVTEKW